MTDSLELDLRDGPGVDLRDGVGRQGTTTGTGGQHRHGQRSPARALVTFAAGTGLRQGEALGLTTDRIDFLRRQLTVDRQLITMPDRAPYLTPPTTQASVRVVPLPQVVIDALAVHLAAWPAAEVLFATELGDPIRRTAFSTAVWRPAASTRACSSGTGSR